MGIRFACHVCEQKLNIKSDLAGRRGICPACSGRFRIPLQDAEKSTPIEEDSDSSSFENKSDESDQDENHSVQERSEQDGNIPNGNLPNGEPAAPGPPATPPEANSSSSVKPAPATQPPPQPATILDDDDDGTWYVRPPSGGQYGPATSELLKEWIAEGRIAATSLLWRDGWPQWRDASEALPELVAKLPGNHQTPDVAARANANRAMSASSSATMPSGPAANPAKLSGDAEVKIQRRKRTKRRIKLIGFLTGLVALLIAGLIYALNQ